MNIFKKIFRKTVANPKSKAEEAKSPFLPERKLPLDERFMSRFKNNGGKFLYCENMDEIFQNFKEILTENNWLDKEVQLFDSALQERFKNFSLKISEDNQADFLFTVCENLIADDGSVLISSNQIGERKLNDLSKNIVVFATTSQIKNNIGESLRDIKRCYGKKIPTNIQAFKHFGEKQEDDFLSYGSSTKNLYLLLLEDL